MINPIQQSYVASASLNNTSKVEREAKTEQSQKVENDRVTKIAEQIKNGTYQVDLKATAAAVADSLI
ncbi:flagellar biosynthesis anti-sigma factor FlgM [Campylobacter upsaliensis]|uniref:flagellar biosynthesis anti-sigma factor FlgM n=1 Tax=Campylobacter upsaliensis TaxID=28080 RepID=UPI001079ED16|nr:flagellar biosynthesis anti-sigma factor FlgM [Campylobacter upsaliensis]EAB5281557.1 flagellar biosynthesis anti-sigma factor FlgM [Campylobacter upsaliensis]EAH4720012.1 flagellar biosynthesis anti-sigma factor FlgM [Campylobacter upsaliensis]EAH5200049.1 flagellar biosynthesis anti-sigma factor FlgM [Campylobacter upsaliensis]EAH5546613.1 flagellar biosynthesis anti-sigma factor FlgM [Campylobacter upsaliensis]EAH5848406.1 flagellar biosynthesis anti-sigma factor FlgM [Campylobacter upsa